MKHVLFDEQLAELVELHRSGLPSGCSTGWPSLDELYTVNASRFTVITGIPNHGKSAWVDALAINLLERTGRDKPWKFLVCSPENMPLELHRATMLEKFAGRRFRNMSAADVKSYAAQLSSRVEFVLMEENETFADLLTDVYSWCNLIKKDFQPGVILDPWNALEHNRPRNIQETDYISDALSAAVRITRKTGAHLWIVAHPQKPPPVKSGEKRDAPDPYSISGSAHWFNKPDNCLCIWRDPLAKDGSADHRRTHVHVQKIRFRHEGHQGSTTLRFEEDSGRYTDAEAGKAPARQAKETA